jgi:hypothetical protein
MGCGVHNRVALATATGNCTCFVVLAIVAMLWSAVAITIFQDASAQAADSSLTLIAF